MSNQSIVVNGERVAVPAACTVRDLLGQLRLEGRVAVAVNRNVVPRSTFDSVALAADDRIEILEAVGGG